MELLWEWKRRYRFCSDQHDGRPQDVVAKAAPGRHPPQAVVRLQHCSYTYVNAIGDIRQERFWTNLSCRLPAAVRGHRFRVSLPRSKARFDLALTAHPRLTPQLATGTHLKGSCL